MGQRFEKRGEKLLHFLGLRCRFKGRGGEELPRRWIRSDLEVFYFLEETKEEEEDEEYQKNSQQKKRTNAVSIVRHQEEENVLNIRVSIPD